MKFRNAYSLIYIICFLFSITINNCQTAEDILALFNKYNGHVWHGHYSNPEDSHYVHKLKFKSKLDGHVFVMSKVVEELKFEMETILYWNPQIQQILFESFTNKGQISNGTVSLTSDRILLIGNSLETEANRKFKQSFHFSENGTMEDRFYLFINGEWKQRHLIIYN